MGDVELNYFVCTLGQAAERQLCGNKGFTTVNSFLDHQARAIPSKPAVAFPSPFPAEQLDPAWSYKLFSKTV